MWTKAILLGFLMGFSGTWLWHGRAADEAGGARAGILSPGQKAAENRSRLHLLPLEGERPHIQLMGAAPSGTTSRA